MRVKVGILIFIAIFVLLSGCSGNGFQEIRKGDITDISVWSDHADGSGESSHRLLTSDEISEFVSLYNASEYNGKATGEGGTPGFGANIILKNSELIVNEFNGKSDFEVFYLNGKALYINNSELYDYLKNIASNI